MSSASKFSHGLNNWAASDKPTRSDFVSDNQIVNDTAMWKSDYDGTGEVKNAGGLTAYAMAKSAYDPQGLVGQTVGGIPGYTMSRQAYDADGSVAQQGGINAAIEEALESMGGFSAYEYGKVGTLHHLTGTGSNIKFIATADYTAGDTVQVNGTAMSLRIQGSTAALGSGFWLTGDAVLCVAQGTVLTFFARGNGMPTAGGDFAGNITAYNTNRTGASLRNCEVVAADGSAVSTNKLRFVRK